MSAIDPQTRMKILSSITRARGVGVDHLLSDVQFAGLNQDEIHFARQSRSDAVWSSVAAVFFVSVAWREDTSSGRPYVVNLMRLRWPRFWRKSARTNGSRR